MIEDYTIAELEDLQAVLRIALERIEARGRTTVRERNEVAAALLRDAADFIDPNQETRS